MSSGKNFGKILAGAGVLALGSLAWGTLVERKLFTLREQTLPILPAGAEPLRVLHISDLHLAPWQDAKIDWLRLLAGVKPDLIINTGDNVGHPDALPALKRALGPLAGIPGVFVNGSNDYFGPVPKNPLSYFSSKKVSRPAARLDSEGMRDFFVEELGWLDLNNEAAVIDLSDLRIEFMGVDDPHIHRDKTVELAIKLDDLRAELEPPAGSLGQITLGVTHAPYQRILNTFLTNGAQAIFAGHTHGGQVRIPGMRSAIVTNCDIPASAARGLSIWHHARRSAYLSVSAGLGTSIYAPFRFACLPEVTLATLVPEGSETV
ncbi:MAG: metallophosphoesterase [Microbacteriaceae bacterium]